MENRIKYRREKYSPQTDVLEGFIIYFFRENHPYITPFVHSDEKVAAGNFPGTEPGPERLSVHQPEEV